MATPASLQLYFNSSSMPLNDATKRNQMRVNLQEAIIVPDGYEMHVSIVSAEIPNTWATLQKYLLVRSNLKYNNQYLTGRYLGKIPVNVATGYYINYVNLTNYKNPTSDKNITYMEISIHNEDGTDVSLGNGSDWSATIQIDFRKI